MIALVIGLSGCAAEGPALTVFAASSLTESFDDLALAFEAEHPGVDVRPVFAGSQQLRLQIEQGAPADVFASADPDHAAALHASGRSGEPVPFSTNRLAVIVPVGSEGVDAAAALSRAERIVVGAETVPIGRYTRAFLSRVGDPVATAVRAHIVSEETNVRLVRAKVELGEADAAIVYRTDARASRRVRSLPIPDTLSPVATYSLATVGEADPLATAFVEFVLGTTGQAVLGERGFSPVEEGP